MVVSKEIYHTFDFLLFLPENRDKQHQKGRPRLHGRRLHQPGHHLRRHGHLQLAGALHNLPYRTQGRHGGRRRHLPVINTPFKYIIHGFSLKKNIM